MSQVTKILNASQISLDDEKAIAVLMAATEQSCSPVIYAVYLNHYNNFLITRYVTSIFINLSYTFSLVE